MKRIIAGVIVVLLIGSLTGCGEQSIQDEVERATGISCENGTVESSMDDHGGFHGDGTSFYEISFSDDEFLNKISSDSNWHELPLETVLEALAYGTEINGIEQGPYVTDEEWNALFPTIENGYYFFDDRNSESSEGQDNMDVLNRNSFNFTLVIYDTDTKTLYYCEFDT